jgi:hypothetical protein
MLVIVSLFVAACGTLSPTVRSWVGWPLYGACVIVTLLALYGMTL